MEVRVLSSPGAHEAGLVLADVELGSSADQAGLAAGDRIVAVDGVVPRDLIDLQFDLPAARQLTVYRDGELVDITLESGIDDAASIQLADPVPGGIRTCTNHCEFCFIRGLPGGLRETLYVFDDDYRYSFLWGNFLTLTNLEASDWARIGFQRLTPLNVSVHATEPALRRQMLNNRHAPDIVPQLQRLSAMGISVNAQVVLCAGTNDGEHLERTIDDLAALYPAVQSLSVVPVGLTRFSRVRTLRRPSREEAQGALALIERCQTELRRRCGKGFVYASDELYLLAGREEMPPSAQYDGFPVLTNGVGMLRSMQDAWDRALRRRRVVPPPRRTAWLAGSLAAPALRWMADRWERFAGWKPEVVEVQNNYFGEQVTVSGLLSGEDLIRTLHSLPPDVEDLVLPRSAFGFDGTRTLDGVSAEAVGAAHPGRVFLATTPEELLEVVGRRGR